MLFVYVFVLGISCARSLAILSKEGTYWTYLNHAKDINGSATNNHEDTLAPPRMANTGLAGVSKTLAKALSSCARTFKKKTNAKHHDVSYWCILYLLPISYHLPSSSIYMSVVSQGQLPSCRVIPQRSLPIRSPAHFTSKPSPTSEAVLRAEYLLIFTVNVGQFFVCVPQSEYFWIFHNISCSAMVPADAWWRLLLPRRLAERWWLSWHSSSLFKVPL